MICSILLPTFNERDNLPIFVFLLSEMIAEGLFGSDLAIEVVIIDDSSPDGTFKIANELKGRFTNIQFKLISRPLKMGLGSAYRDGVGHCNGELVVVMDADLSHHPKYLPELLAKQVETDADIVTCSRYCEGGGVEGWSFYRKLTSRTANYIASMALGTQYSDLTGSYRIYKKTVISELMKRVTTRGYSFQMEILIRAERMKLNIKEIPIVFVDRLFGESKLLPGEIWLYLQGVLKLYLQM